VAEEHRARKPVTRLNASDRARIVTRHAAALERHGYGPQALFWQNREVQETRFRVFVQAMVPQPETLLDVGCGFGDFYAFMRQQGIRTDFTGLDISPDMILAARSRFPNACWLEGELLTACLPAESYDVVALSGALNEPIEQADGYARAVIERMWLLARRQVLFNMLHRGCERTARSPFLVARDPDEVLRWCRTHTQQVRVVEGYLPHDFTIVMEK